MSCRWKPGNRMRIPFASNSATAFPNLFVDLGGLGFRFWWIVLPARKALADLIILYHHITMSPDRRSRRRQQSVRQRAAPQVRTRPSSDDAHEVVFFRRHRDDDPEQAIPGREFLNACPVKVRATMRAVLAQVAAAPPKRFAGGGYWEAMKGEMTGWFEVRVDGPRRHHYRLFCRLDYDGENQPKPLLVVICGLDKPFRTELSDADYRHVRDLGKEYLRRNRRSLA
jgi:hypothetical protein